jgi:uncharacterized alpha/beta hydrolase family protein
MEFTKTQTTIIVIELVAIFTGVVALVNNARQHGPAGTAGSGKISTAVVSTMYTGMSTAQEGVYKPAKKRRPRRNRADAGITIEFDKNDAVSSDEKVVKKKKRPAKRVKRHKKDYVR